MSRYQPIQSAPIDWQENGPFSRSHDDIYFSTDNGLAESDYVFIKGNQLPERWQECDSFSIAETGFGTGLNFLCTVQAWLKQPPSKARLNFISAEKFPLSQQDLSRALSQWPELSALADELIEHYPPLCHGHHQRTLYDGRVQLTLMLGDAETMFADLDMAIDAWYLDGFAPTKNPAMWNAALFQQIARLTTNKGSFATFTAAGSVRRGLEAVGFKTQRPPGFGRKRNMLTGTLTQPPGNQPKQPWFHFAARNAAEKKAIVIGGGLAGCSVSHQLAQRGWQVELIERHKQLANEASGNLAGVAMPRLTADMNAAGQFYLSAFLHSQQWFNRFKQQAPELPWFQSGVLQLEDSQRLQQLAKLELPRELIKILDANQAAQACGIPVKRGALLFPNAGWLEPPALCRYLIEDQRNNITTQFHSEALTLQHHENHWQVLSNGSLIGQAETLIIANGFDAQRLLPTQQLGLQQVRGQASYLEPSSASQKIKMPICFAGYLLPHYQNQHCAGATYDLNDKDLSVKPDHAKQIIELINEELGPLDFRASSQGRAAFRTSSQDHLPLIGPLADPSFFKQAYDDLHHGRPVQRYPLAKHLPGLFISTGHGSRGLVSCPFAAQLLADLICEGQSSISRALQHAVHPARFLIRRLKSRH